jgi:hypothetical protein
MTEDEMLLLALEESASLHQCSITNETCTQSFNALSRSGMRLLQLPIVNQFHPIWNPLISKYCAPSAICGYTAIACARFIAGLENVVTKSDLQRMLSRFATISEHVEDAMKYIHTCRREYIQKNSSNFTQSSEVAYIKCWVANFEISDYFRHNCPQSDRSKIAFVRFNQYSELCNATHEEHTRISAHESGYNDAQILVETFNDSDMLAKRPHFHRPHQLQPMPQLRAAVVDVNGHFACAAMCSDGCALFNTLDTNSILFPGGETTAVALGLFAGGETASSQSDTHGAAA